MPLDSAQGTIRHTGQSDFRGRVETKAGLHWARREVTGEERQRV